MQVCRASSYCAAAVIALPSNCLLHFDCSSPFSQPKSFARSLSAYKPRNHLHFLLALMSALSRSPSNATRDEEKRKRVEKEQGHPHIYTHPANSLINGSNGPVPAASPSIANGGPGASVGDERPPSRGMVIFSVLFYLVAALVMVQLSSVTSTNKSAANTLSDRSWRINGYSTLSPFRSSFSSYSWP